MAVKRRKYLLVATLNSFSLLVCALLVQQVGTSETDPAQIAQSVAIVGGEALMPCNTTAPGRNHPPILVIWYKNGGGDPVYSYDLRGDRPESGRHWSDSHALGARAMFYMNKPQMHNKKTNDVIDENSLSYLKIAEVRNVDRGMYRCRVDFQAAPTRNSKANLTVIVPPRLPIIVNESGRESGAFLGPYPEGTTVRASCEVSGGRPKPTVTWTRGGEIVIAESEVSSGTTVTSTLMLVDLKRSDNEAILTCEANNNNISAPVFTSVTLLMNLPPTAVWITKKDQHLLSGKEATFFCSATGASPKLKFTWYLNDQQLSLPAPGDMRVNSSTLVYVPSIGDHRKVLTCKAENPDLQNSAIQDSFTLQVHYIPMTSLQYGANLNANSIKEGDDIYFECIVQARPPVTKLQWYQNGKELMHNIEAGVIISNQSLVIQGVIRNTSGEYTCKATNPEGSAFSNKLRLDVQYVPMCANGEARIFGVALLERLELSCDVTAHPMDLSFHWHFNNSVDEIDLTHFVSNRTRSVLTFSPVTQRDYGTVSCFANNEVGRQRTPCQFHIIPAGRPDSVSECNQFNHSTDSIHLKCVQGFDGGLTQLFTLELRYLDPPSPTGLETPEEDSLLVRNLTITKPVFSVYHLRPGTRFEATIYSSNRKGRSSPSILRVSTLKRQSEKRLATTASDQNGLVDQPAEDELTHRAADAATDIHSGTTGSFLAGFPFTVRTLLLILISIVAVMLIVAISIGVICRIQCQTVASSPMIPASPRTESEIQDKNMTSSYGSTGLDNGSHDNLRLKLDHHRSDSMILLQRSDTISTTAIGSEEELLAREEHPDIVRQLSSQDSRDGRSCRTPEGYMNEFPSPHSRRAFRSTLPHNFHQQRTSFAETSSTFVPVTSSQILTPSSSGVLTLSASQLKPEQLQCSHRCIRLQRGSSVDKLTSSEQNFFHEANESLTHFQPYIEESLGSGRDRTRGLYLPAPPIDADLPIILPPPAKMFACDKSDLTSPPSSSSSSTMHTFPRHRRVIECQGTFLPPPPPPHGDEFATTSQQLSKSDRRKTVTFLGDVETIPACGDESKSIDFFPLPPPLLPLMQIDNEKVSIDKTVSEKDPKDSSSSNSPDYVESRV